MLLLVHSRSMHLFGTFFEISGAISKFVAGQQEEVKEGREEQSVYAYVKLITCSQVLMGIFIKKDKIK